MNKDKYFNLNKKIAKNYALINARIIKPSVNVIEKGGLLIKGKLIEDFGQHIQASNISDNYEIIDCKNSYLAPGLVDIRVQIREPGLEHQETIKSVSKSACSGGISSLVCLPNTKPIIDN